MWTTTVCDRIAELTHQPFILQSKQDVAGGCINQAYLLKGHDGRRFFIKLNSANCLDMFAAESEALTALALSNSIRVPSPLSHGLSGQYSYLIMEHLALGSGNSTSQTKLGEGLATMHLCSQEKFGWQRNNTIGSTLQINTQTSNWTEFWRQQRLGFQLELAKQNGYGDSLQEKGQRLLERLDVFFQHKPKPSLLHGDLWSGNYAVTTEGEPVIFDPALYYGDRETDLAMTELFGGFSAEFYVAYQANYPLDKGYATRKTLYNLYHILNHLNLFGRGYLSQAETMIDRLLSESA